MSVTFEKLMPWSGAVAGLCWVAQDALRHTSTDVPGGASTQIIRDHLGLNYGSQACLVVMGLALLLTGIGFLVLVFRLPGETAGATEPRAKAAVKTTAVPTPA